MGTSPFALWRWRDAFDNIHLFFIEGFSHTLLVSILALSIAVMVGAFMF